MQSEDGAYAGEDTALLKIMVLQNILHSEAIEQGSSIIFHRGPNSANKTKPRASNTNRLDTKSKRTNHEAK